MLSCLIQVSSLELFFQKGNKQELIEIENIEGSNYKCKKKSNKYKVKMVLEPQTQNQKQTKFWQFIL